MATTQQQRDLHKKLLVKSGIYETMQRNLDKIHYEDFEYDRLLNMPPTQDEFLALGKKVFEILYN